MNPGQHVYQPFTTRDGSQACSQCEAVPGAPIHIQPGRPMPLKHYHLKESNRPIEVFRHWMNDGGGLLLDPPYQRGDVWGLKRRQNLIRSLLMGVPIPSIIINQRMYAEGWGDDYRVAVIDGRQRITTILMFVDDKFSVPADWFRPDLVMVAEHGQVLFSGLTKVAQRKLMNRTMPTCEARVSSLEEEQEIFDLVNFGGLSQGETDADLVA